MEKDHLEVLLEDIRSKFDLALEGHAVLDKKIDDFRQEFVEFRQETEFKNNLLNKKIDSLRQENEAAHLDSGGG